MSAEAANRLINEKSPYLLQHAHNPVNWYPWGDEAFEKARQEDKPVFVSIGYSTCHWCHVMAHESFEDAEVAAILNAQFVSVKVDREERPDVDAVYMAACQALTGGGGWPLTVLLDADKRPFFAGTYFPKHARFGHMGLVDLLINISRQWQSDRQRLTEAGAQMVEYLKNASQSHREGEPDRKLIADGVQLFKRMFDRQNGGFGTPPKFPSPHNLLFLLRYAKLEKDETALAMATHTLTQMARGGLFDQIGGGFSRYSTDAKWLIPHFEKMLYDNALLALAYTEGYVQTGSPYFREIATRTLDYVLRELKDATGGFHCGQDADSDGVEGKFYAFNPEEVNGVLADESREFCRTYDITKLGNFEGQSIVNLLACESFERAYTRHISSHEALYRYRIERTKLHKDDKILTSWNALMIHTLSVAAAVFRDQRYFKAALDCVSCIQKRLTSDDGRLFVRYRDGEARHMGQLDDYAFFALALLFVYSVNFDERMLARAIELGNMMLSLFFDENRGGFYLTASDSEQLIMRPKEVHDGAIPSGNGVAALVLGKLFRLTGDTKWQHALDKQMRFLCGAIKAYPVGHSVSLLALTQMLYPASELICVSANGGMAPSLLEALCGSAFANLSVLFKTPGNADALSAIAPWTKDYPVPEYGTMYYLCENGACNAPTNDVDSVLEMLSASMQ